MKCDKQGLDPSAGIVSAKRDKSLDRVAFAISQFLSVVHRGEDAVEKFLNNPLLEEKCIKDILKRVGPMSISNVEEQAFFKARLTVTFAGEEKFLRTFARKFSTR